MLVLSIPAAYALSIRPVRKWTDVMFFFLSTKMLPVVAGLLPIYLIAQNAGMLDNIYILVILYTSMNLPIAVWMMRSFLAEVPVEMLEAASIDGAGLICTLRSIVVPIAVPGIAATSLICFIFSWNELLFARVLTGDRRADRTGVPHRLRHQPGPVPGQGVRGRRRGVAPGARRRLRRAGQAGAGSVAGGGQVKAAVIKSVGNVSVETVDDPTPGLRRGHRRGRGLRTVRHRSAHPAGRVRADPADRFPGMSSPADRRVCGPDALRCA